MADLGLEPITPRSEQTVLAPKQKVRQRIIIEGDGDDQLAEFAEYLRKIIK